MTPSVTATKAGKLLGLSPKTLRRRLEVSYNGPEKILGAEKDEREWLIPSSEIARILEERRAKVGAAQVGGQAARLAEAVWAAGTSSAVETLRWAAEKCTAPGSEEDLRDLENAARSFVEWRTGKRVVDAVRESATRSYTDALEAMNDPEESGELVAGDAEEYVKQLAADADGEA